MLEKQRFKEEEAAKKKEERKQAEEAEIQLMRKQSTFKASPVRHYSSKLGPAPEKKPTIPREP